MTTPTTSATTTTNLTANNDIIANIASDIEVLTFDVFGTVVNWFGTVSQYVKQKADEEGLELSEEGAADFAREWRNGYMQTVAAVARGEPGTMDVDTMHREILEGMLSSPRWTHLGQKWSSEDERKEMNLIWHKLEPWPDTIKGMQRLRKKYILSSLSNGNIRLQVDMAKHSSLPFDLLLPSTLFNSYKPHPIVYTSALSHFQLSSTPQKCLMVAAHIYDLRAASGCNGKDGVGMRTVYVRRVTEDTEAGVRDGVKAKYTRGPSGEVVVNEAGEVDFVVDSFEELADLLGCE